MLSVTSLSGTLQLCDSVLPSAVNTPSAKADGFRSKPCGNPLAWRSAARSMREPESPLMHYHRRRDIPVEGATAITAVRPLGERFLGDGLALRAGLASPARIDLDQLATGSCSLVREHVG